MKKLIVNRREYDIECTDVVCEENKITVGDKFEIFIPEGSEAYLETGQDRVRIEIPQ